MRLSDVRSNQITTFSSVYTFIHNRLKMVYRESVWQEKDINRKSFLCFKAYLCVFLTLSLSRCLHSHPRIHVPLRDPLLALPLPRRRLHDAPQHRSHLLAHPALLHVHRRRRPPFPLSGRFTQSASTRCSTAGSFSATRRSATAAIPRIPSPRRSWSSRPRRHTSRRTSPRATGDASSRPSACSSSRRSPRGEGSSLGRRPGFPVSTVRSAAAAAGNTVPLRRLQGP